MAFFSLQKEKKILCLVQDEEELSALKQILSVWKKGRKEKWYDCYRIM